MKKTTTLFGALATVLVLVSGGARAVPVTYTFTTGAGAIGTAAIHERFIAAGGAGASVSGSFQYDPDAPFVEDVPGLGRAYGGHSDFSKVASFSGLAGTISAPSGLDLGFTDPRGVVAVGNDRGVVGFPGPVDILNLFSDPGLTSSSLRNFSGFTLGDYRLARVRFFWIETQSVPELIGDFLDDEDLPLALPGFHGRLGLDFVRSADASPTAYAGFLFFDGVQVTAMPVPEPPSFAMALAALGILFAVRGRFTPRRIPR